MNFVVGRLYDVAAEVEAKEDSHAIATRSFDWRCGCRSGCAGTRRDHRLGQRSQPSTPVNFDVRRRVRHPHAVFGEPQRFPFGAARAYTPEPASVGEIARLHSAGTRTESW